MVLLDSRAQPTFYKHRNAILYLIPLMTYNVATGTDASGKTLYTSTADAPSGASVISALGLSNTPTPAAIPTPPVSGFTPAVAAGGNAVLAANTVALTQAQLDAQNAAKGITQTTPAAPPVPNYVKDLMDSMPKPPSATDTYNADYAASGIDQKTAAYNDSKAKFDAINAQMQGISAEGNAQKLAQENTFGTTGNTVGQQAQIDRQTTIRQLGLQGQALAAQAEMSGSQAILQQAQDHLDKIFQIHTADAQAQYQYQTNLVDKVYAYADKEQQIQLDAAKTKAAQDFQTQQATMNDVHSAAQSLLKTAPGVAGKLIALDPTSATYQADAAKLLAQVPATNPTSTTPGGNTPVSTVGGNGVLVAGIKVDPTISNDVQAVLEGRNTLYNIRQTMGRTNAAAAYMQKMRDTIASIDPHFDFVASDAGGKFVSTAFYQKATTAITSVLPNIDQAVQLSDQVGRIGVAGIDKLLQAGQMQIGNQKVSNFHEAQKLIADEIGLALGQGTVSDMKLQLGIDITDPSLRPEVFASNMGIVKDFISNRLAALKAQRYTSDVVGNSGSSLPTDVQATVSQNVTFSPDKKTAYLPRSVWSTLGSNMDAILAEAKAEGFNLLIQ